MNQYSLIYYIYIFIFKNIFKHFSLMQKTAQISQQKTINEILCKLQLLTSKMSKENYYLDICLYIQQLTKLTDRQGSQLCHCKSLGLEMKQQIKLKNKELKRIQKHLLIKIDQYKQQLSTKNQRIIQLTNRISDLQQKNKKIKSQEQNQQIVQARERNIRLQNQLKIYKNNMEDLIQKNKQLVSKIELEKLIQENKNLKMNIDQLQSIGRSYKLLEHQKQNIQYQLYETIKDYEEIINQLHIKIQTLSKQNFQTQSQCKSSETCESANFDIYEFTPSKKKKKYKSKKNILKRKNSNHMTAIEYEIGPIFQTLQDQEEVVSSQKSMIDIFKVIGICVLAMLIGCL